MTLVFRNIDASPADPVESWPTEAVITALERGGCPTGTDWAKRSGQSRGDWWHAEWKRH